MADERDGARRSDYRAARVGAASALVGVVVLLLVIDALSTEYAADPVILTALLGAIVTLLGIEARRIVGGTGK